MVDDQEGSVWSHLDGVAFDGPLNGTALPILPLLTTTWGAWLSDHPDTTVIDIATGFEMRYRDEVRTGASTLGKDFRASLDRIDERLPTNEIVIGVLAGSEAAAFPVDRRPPDAPMQGVVGGVPVVILEDRDGEPALAYHRALTDGRVLTFERRDGAIHDVQTGSRWSGGGLAVAGGLKGAQLTFVTSFYTEWYGWAAFHPDTAIYTAADPYDPYA